MERRPDNLRMDRVADWPREAKLWIGAITVVAWIVLCGSYVAIEQMERDGARSRQAVRDVTDPDYLLMFRTGLDDDE